MKTINRSETLCAFDGKRILRIMIDFPESIDTKASEYLSEYARGCYRFAKGKLYLAYSEIYNVNYPDSKSMACYNYAFNIIETFTSECIASYLLKATLSQGRKLVYTGIDSVIFYNDYVVPRKLLCRKRADSKQVIVLDDTGAPSKATVTDSVVSFNKLSAYAPIIQ